MKLIIGVVGISAVSSVGVLGATALIGSRHTTGKSDSKFNVTPAGEVVSPPIHPARRVAKTLQPVIAMGTTALEGGVIAVRSDSDVTLLFDEPMVRTRIAEKFERFVRATLPALYGARVDSALQHIPAGALASQGDLLTELPQRGLRIISTDWRLTLYPATRPGQDGPLVVRYRVVSK